ncbi:MAG: glycosyltransferase, partial [bacterium]|nr:glycosyltransferase [bacterium]
MLKFKSNIIYNLNYLIVLPRQNKELLDVFNYNFKNVYYVDDFNRDIENLKKVLQTSNIKKIIFVNYILEFNDIISSFDGEKDIIFTYSIDELSINDIYDSYLKIYDLHIKKQIKKLGFLDCNLYKALSNNKNIFNIVLDQEIPKYKANSSKINTIGLINSSINPNCSYFNELSAVKLNNKYISKIFDYGNEVRNFLKTFNIEYIEAKSISDLYSNRINLNVNFSGFLDMNFIKSMDLGVLCLLGNNCILQDFPDLGKYLFVNSDDDINEISNKIDYAIQNEEKIFEEYKAFRKKYTEKSKQALDNFLEVIENKPTISKKSELLLSVIVPVYNTSKYLSKCLDSIIKAKIDYMEILVINDGSTDNSDEIIDKYVKKYPKLIRKITQSNKGLGNVRNVGLKEAKGKYIASIDSDDTINIRYFIDCLEYLEDDIDVVVYDWLTITNDGKFATSAVDYIFNNNKFNKYEGIMYTTIMPSTCNKIIKKSLFDELDIKYIEDKYEDLSTNPFILLKSNKIAYLNRPYYEYYIRENSIMRTKPGYSMIDILKIVDSRILKYKDMFLSINGYEAS